MVMAWLLLTFVEEGAPMPVASPEGAVDTELVSCAVARPVGARSGTVGGAPPATSSAAASAIVKKPSG